LTTDIPYGKAPDHATISWHERRLGRLPLGAHAGNKPVHIQASRTRLSVYVGILRGPLHGWDERKLHIAGGATTGDVIATDLSSKCAMDAKPDTTKTEWNLESAADS